MCGDDSVLHVQEMLAHADISTTQIHTHLAKSDLKAIHARTSANEHKKEQAAAIFELGNWRPRKRKKVSRKKPNRNDLERTAAMSYVTNMTITHQTVMGEDGRPSAVLIPWNQFELIRKELEDMKASPEEEEAIAEAQRDRAEGNDEAFMDLKDFMADCES